MKQLALELGVATVGALACIVVGATLFHFLIGGWRDSPGLIPQREWRPTPQHDAARWWRQPLEPRQSEPRESRERPGAPSWMSKAAGDCVLSHRSYSGRVDLRFTFACEAGWSEELTCEQQRLGLNAMLAEFVERRSTAHTVSIQTASGITIGQINRGMLGGLSYHCGG